MKLPVRILFQIPFLWLTVASVFAQLPGEGPKLVVGVVVDQMRFDQLERYGSRFGSEGFNRLLERGFNFKNAQIDYIPSFTAPGHASIYTGNPPSLHGIVGNSWFERMENAVVISVEDSTVTAVGTQLPNPYGLSPRRMLLPGISDALRVSTKDEARVVSISLKDRGAILPGGHRANAAYWHDWETSPGYFVSSTYYMDKLPAWVSRFNQKEKSDAYLDNKWEPLYPLETYTASGSDNSPFERAVGGKESPTFPYDFSELRKKFIDSGSEYQLLWLSPYGNSLLTDFAMEAIKNEGLGKDNVPDMLFISYTVTDVIGHTLGQQSVEMEDVILRLDRDIADLLKYLDKKVGQGKYLFFLTSDHGGMLNGSGYEGTPIPAGVASIGRYKIALTNFLNKKYGAFPWIMHFDNEQLYLNRELIAGQNINLAVIQDEVAAFLKEQEGIADALTAYQLQSKPYEEGLKKMVQNGFNPDRSGDIILVYQPGYVVDQRTNLNQDQIKGSTHGSGYIYDTHIPLIWFGQGIPHGVSLRAVSATDIAPTLSSILNLAPANGFFGQPLREILGN